jgi:L-aminopeptidase/D-esterase-like protein
MVPRVRLAIGSAFLVGGVSLFLPLQAQHAARARDLGVPFAGTPGPLNAITDVAGVTVGHATIVKDLPASPSGPAAVRTGVTAVLPRGRDSVTTPVFGGWFSLNGNGEMTGTTWLEESGQLEGPVLITNTHSVGVVRDAAIKWLLRGQASAGTEVWWGLPVVAETWDGRLNDINGHHVTDEHAYAALDSARAGQVAEGNVGGGTGMVCYGFKGGIGTSSRVVRAAGTPYTLGVLLQANFGRRAQLTVAGVPVGAAIPERIPAGDAAAESHEAGSVIVVVATDAPLLPHQLKRLARRVSLGLARTGSVSGNGSGDIFVAFSTANAGALKPAASSAAVPVLTIPNDAMDPFFAAVVEATEESVINALVAAETMTGHAGRTVVRLPHDRLVEELRSFKRLERR